MTYARLPEDITAQHVRDVLGRMAGTGRQQWTLSLELSDYLQRRAADRGTTVSRLVEEALTAHFSFVTSAVAAQHLSFLRLAREPGADTVSMLATSMAGQTAIAEPWHPESRHTWLNFEAVSGLEAAGMPRSEAKALAGSIDWSTPPVDLTRHSMEVQRREEGERRWEWIVSDAVIGLRGDVLFDVAEHLRNQGISPRDIDVTEAEVRRRAAAGDAPTFPVGGGLAGL